MWEGGRAPAVMDKKEGKRLTPRVRVLESRHCFKNEKELLNPCLFKPPPTSHTVKRNDCKTGTKDPEHD